jgi:trimethylamine--corrinoid protein Co-methyltransferase
MIYGLGMLESGITFDYGQLVLDCEFARMIKHTVQGFRVTDDMLALDVIKEIGPGGHYLMHEHTLGGMHGQSRPELIDRQIREVWKKAGATTAYERATAKAKWILENHKPEPLPDNVLDKIRAIVVETEKEMGITNGENK